VKLFNLSPQNPSQPPTLALPLKVGGKKGWILRTYSVFLQTFSGVRGWEEGGWIPDYKHRE